MKNQEDMLAFSLTQALRDSAQQELSQFEEYTGNFSLEFENKMKKLIARSKRSVSFYSNSFSKKAAILVIALIIILATLTFSVEAIRKPIINFFTSIYDNFIQIIYNEHNATPGSSILDSNSNIVPKWLPRGYDLKEENKHDGLMLELIYADKSDNEIIIQKKKIENTNDTTNNIYNDYDSIVINNYQGLYYTLYNTKNVLWSDDTYVYIISGNLSKAELIKIAESIVY